MKILLGKGFRRRLSGRKDAPPPVDKAVDSIHMEEAMSTRKSDETMKWEEGAGRETGPLHPVSEIQ
jgi:hypothetical protein